MGLTGLIILGGDLESILQSKKERRVAGDMILALSCKDGQI